MSCACRPGPHGAVVCENCFGQGVVELARLCGWKVARWPTWRATGTDPGVPDLLLARRGVIILAELKAERGKLTPAQQEWQDAAKGGALTVVWRPSDWPMIEELLGTAEVG